jgi:hypothetical protein
LVGGRVDLLPPAPPDIRASFDDPTLFMKRFHLITLVAMIAASGASQTYAQSTEAPLCLFINGGGSVSPLTNGEFLEVGQDYNMVATPAAGFAFDSWQPVNVFTMTNFIYDTNGNSTPEASFDIAPIPTFTNQLSLDFIMQPVAVLIDIPGDITVTESRGWQANFDPIIIDFQCSSSALILTWTNSSCKLQAAPAPTGVYTNVPGAVSPYTTDISGPARYFRLVSD